MKKTAIDWLVDESMKLLVQYIEGTLNEDTLDDVIYELGTKAKQLEKQQIIQAHEDAYMDCGFEYSASDCANNYYNKKFKL